MLAPDAARAKGIQLLDTRFTPEWLATHDGDRGLAEMMAARRASAKSAEQLRGEAEQLGARSRHDVCDRLAAITAPTPSTIWPRRWPSPLPWRIPSKISPSTLRAR